MKTLYEPQFEHDNCGVGSIININGKASHDIVSDALSIVENLEHRAGKDAEGKTWMFYHGYLRTAPEKGRVAWLDEVKWSNDGWPYFIGAGASWGEQTAPATAPENE